MYIKYTMCVCVYIYKHNMYIFFIFQHTSHFLGASGGVFPQKMGLSGCLNEVGPLRLLHPRHTDAFAAGSCFGWDRVQKSGRWG